jgi:hypothetical protein
MALKSVRDWPCDVYGAKEFNRPAAFGNQPADFERVTPTERPAGRERSKDSVPIA